MKSCERMKRLSNIVSFEGRKMSSAAGNSKETSGGFKRSRQEGAIVGVTGPRRKRQKMDRSVTLKRLSNIVSFEGKKMSSAAGNSKETSGGCKRSGPGGAIVGVTGPQRKRRKLDRVTQQCSSLLKTLMKHPYSARVFNQPLNRIALKKNPMDLSKIKSKLEKNTYLGIEEFVADIKLMFSNAMLCNPPSNNVHKMAEQVRVF
ncbi:hypothetical protein CRYUN_Cryun05aG0179000 [Craigia yunnanensis]